MHAQLTSPQFVRQRALVALGVVALLAVSCSGNGAEDPAVVPTEAAGPVAAATPIPSEDILTRTVQLAADREPAAVGQVALPAARCPNGATEEHLHRRAPLSFAMAEPMLDKLQTLRVEAETITDELATAGKADNSAVRLWITDRPVVVVATVGPGFLDLCQRLREVMTDPDDLVMLCCEAELAGQSIVTVLVDQILAGSGDAVLARRQRPDGTTQVVLRASAEELGIRLYDRLGRLVDVTIGHLAYPLVDVVDANRSVCGLAPTAEPVDNLGVVLEEASFAAPSVRGDEGLLTVTIRNEGDEPFRFTNPHVGVATGPGRQAQLAAPVAAGDGVPASTDELAPGQARTITAAIGTASCVPAVGYQLPAGDYDALLQLQVSGGVVEIRVPFTLSDT